MKMPEKCPKCGRLLRGVTTCRYCQTNVELLVLRDRCRVLESALRMHRHTTACWEYAITTAIRSGVANCIAECADSHRKALVETDPGCGGRHCRC